MEQLKIGDKAPDFSAKNQNGEIISLKDYKGKGLILYFYPRDNTPGCTAEACNLQENMDFWVQQGYDIIGVSPDGEKSHKSFAEKFKLGFNLLCDPDKNLLKAYGAWGEKKMYGKLYEGVLRTTFVIGAEGKIEQIFRSVDTKNHSTQIAKELNLK